ncbi:lytic transglycosylase domain-containing protein [Nitrosomonas oligotropha]|uniref:Transglycosylase SLT domain-containing protein n=1 Tax=Nitrosomonas oligotropha TaxID=42354 RepID=A0A1H8KTS9_9PROT|nr:lytic transglycosylase domain-containing protein [Nitrosomonas oligotropha]SDX29943.1 Transglycosylase SLT domain-containing protein [Nitrosomonas oligotropha]SEN95798.1 Transglycosylase SLT domain-containing protein [Nitrosomonas oligotropha]
MDKKTRASNPGPANVKPRPKRRRTAAARNSDDPGKSPRKRPQRNQPGKFQQTLLLTGIEILGLSSAAVCAIILLLGYSASQFSGTSFFGHLLPFTAGVLVLILAASVFLLSWWKLRQWLRRYSEFFMPVLSLSLALLTGWLVTHDQFSLAYGNFRTLVGGKEEAGRVTISHQVYAAYRRHDSAQLQKMVNRSQEYRQAIEDAARSFDIDAHLLHGIAATESSFIPRDSHDGGRGLFQITRVPEAVITQARRRLNVEKIVLDNPRHNAFVAAATFKHYLAEMKDDLFLGLLAYNIGPANGGLRFIMQQYGATDFTTIQPYLQTLPRDYPIRVLAYSLAFRLWHQEGRLLAYEEGNNAIRIQRIGIPGLHAGL